MKYWPGAETGRWNRLWHRRWTSQQQMAFVPVYRCCSAI